MNINVYKVRRIVGKILMHGLMITLSFLVLMPLLLGLSVSLQTKDPGVSSYPPSFVPSTLYFGNYADAWRLGNLGKTSPQLTARVLHCDAGQTHHWRYQRLRLSHS